MSLTRYLKDQIKQLEEWIWMAPPDDALSIARIQTQKQLLETILELAEKGEFGND